MADYTEEEIKKLKAVSEAIGNLEGVAIPFNIIRQNVVPFANWLKEVLAEKEEDVDAEEKDERAREEGFERRLQGLGPEEEPEPQEYDGPDEAKEWEDFEGPELPAEEG